MADSAECIKGIEERIKRAIFTKPSVGTGVLLAKLAPLLGFETAVAFPEVG